MKKPELVIFDMAGTTVYDGGSPVHRCLRESLASAGVAVTHEQVNAVMGLPKPDAIRQLLICGSESRVAEIHAYFVERSPEAVLIVPTRIVSCPSGIRPRTAHTPRRSREGGRSPGS